MIVDSGVSEHVVADINPFHSVTNVDEVEVKLANGNTVKSRHKDKVFVDAEVMTLALCTVYIIPTPHLNLSSCTRLDEYRITTLISQKECNLVYREKNDHNITAIPRR